MTTSESQTVPSLVLFKIGGSLLDLPNLAAVLRSAIAQRTGWGAVLLVGGGEAANVVRTWDRTFRLSAEDAHWLAIEAMGLNEALLTKLLPEVRVARSARQVSMVVAEGHPALICADCFLRWGEASGFEPLPRTWQVTSDSIAAWTAQVLSADELVLIKSVAAPLEMTIEQAAAAGLVDPCFTQVAHSISRVAWLNARDGNPRIESWQTLPR